MSVRGWRGRLRANLLLAFLLLAVAACTPVDSTTSTVGESVTTATSPSSPIYEVVGSEPCPESRFECVTLSVPRDHFSSGGPSWEVTYAIQRAAVKTKGTFVTINGGPGVSGISVADSYTDLMAPGITDNYDIVFIDQRGVGLSRPMQCQEAAIAYYATGVDPADLDLVAADTRTFVDDCLEETGVPTEDLPFFATRQAIEDLEAIRDHLGAETIHLYGESYGTQYVQYYAAAYPERVAALFVDAVVDLTVDALPYYLEAARAYEDALVGILAACSAEDVCGVEAGGDALAVYDDLIERLASGPIEYDFPLPDGTAERRQFTRANLDNAAEGFITSLTDRMLLQRAVVAAGNGNIVPLARMAYESLAIDPESLETAFNLTWSDAMYYAVECQDYSFFPDGGTPEERLAAWFDLAAAEGVDGLRLGAPFYGDLPCLFWPAQPGEVARPEPIIDPPYPTFVLTSDADTATPIANALRVFGRWDDSYLILLEGGPHVVFGWGFACVDDLVSGYLETGTPPLTRVTLCDGEIADSYVANASVEVDEYDNALELMATMESQILTNSTFYYWDVFDVLTMGCDFGGTIEYVPTDLGADITLDACEYTDELSMTGTGSLDFETGEFILDIETPSGDLVYENDTETATVTGTFEGQEVSEEG